MNESFTQLASYYHMDEAQLNEASADHGAPLRLVMLSSVRMWIFDDGFRLNIPHENQAQGN